MSDLHAARQALEYARAALRSGDYDAARRRAEQAAALAPHLEDPWLILAAVAQSPQDSIRYVQRALKINPRSKRARQGMAWAQKRLPKHIPVPAQEKTAPVVSVSRQKNKNRFWQISFPALAATVLVVSLIWAFMPHTPSFASVAATATATARYWAQADIAKPTYTPSPTATFTPTPTLTSTPTITPTPVPSATLTSQPTRPAPTIAPPAAQAPSAPAGQKRVVVDISEQRMYVYQGDRLVYNFIASTGMNNATATGHFSVLNKIPNAYGSTWDIWMPNWLGIYWAGTLQNGIHALPIMSNGARLWAGYLGAPISYGCIVLGVNDAQTLYDWVDVGTPVDIQW